MNDDTTTTNEDTAVILYPLNNDVDVDGDTLNIVAVGNAAHEQLRYLLIKPV